jgi:O-antigen/teichoic acid export membrane protein
MDQGLSSLTNFILGIVVARSVGASEFGAFGFAYSIFIVAVGVTRGLTSEPLAVRFSSVEHRIWVNGTASATGCGMSLGFIVGIVLVLTGWVAGPPVGGVLVALGLCLPGLLLQDIWRYAFVAQGRSQLAFVTDLLFLLLMVPAFGYLLGTGKDSAPALVFGWGISATIAGLAAISRTRLLPRASESITWLRQQGDLAFRYVAEFAVVNGALQVALLLIVVYAGLPALGAFRAGLILFGPILVVSGGALLVAVPEGVRILRVSKGTMRRFIFALAAILSTIALLWGVVLSSLPDGVGQALLGDSWKGASALLVPLTVFYTAAGAETGLVVGLRSLGAARRSLKVRIIQAVLTLIGGAIGASRAGAFGVAWALAVVYVFDTSIWWVQFDRALGAHPPGPADSGSPIDNLQPL